MTKTISRYVPNTARNITWLWAVALLPLPAMLMPRDDAIIAFTVIIASFIATLLLSALLPKGKGNTSYLLVPGSILSAINTTLALDYWNETSSTYVYDACGVGFNAGNCFLVDGIGIISYLLIIPVLVIAANILFTVNILRKSNVVTVKQKASKLKTNQ